MTTRAPSCALALVLLIFGLAAGPALATSAVVAPSGPLLSAPALYNLANSYARERKPGLAVLNYERASVLAPTDSDILANLRYVRTQAALPPIPGSWFGQVVRWSSPNSSFWLGCAGLLLMAIATLAARSHPASRHALRIATGTGLLLIVATLANAAATWPLLHEAVVIAPSTPARVAPVSDAETLFTLPEAQSVAMQSVRASFALVRTSSGREGWVARADLATVLP